MSKQLYTEYEAKAHAAKRSINELCNDAGVAPSTVLRWKAGSQARWATVRALDAALKGYKCD